MSTDPAGLVPVVNRFDYYIAGRFTPTVCSFQTLLPPAQARWGALGDKMCTMEHGTALS